MKKTYKFEHKGETFEIPAFTELPIGVIRKSRKATDEADQAFTIIETVCGEDSKELAAIDEMNASEFEKFITGWTQGASLGESSGSEN